MKTFVPVVKRTEVKHFGEMLMQGFEMIGKACQLYVKAIDENPDLKHEFQEEYPTINSAMWARFERVGRGVLRYKLLTSTSSATAVLSRMPYSDQQRYLDNPVELLTTDGDVLKVLASNLTPEQVKQVFSFNAIRSLSEQKAYIESQKLRKKALQAGEKEKYRVQGGKLIVGGSVFSKAELLTILCQMEK